MKDYKSFYKNLTGYEPYEYQLKVGELLLSDKNVVLSVPTGAGKTWASLIPFLYAKEKELSTFPQKMIYSLPLRTLANSIHTDVTKVIHKNKNLTGLTSLHTGEYKNDEYFENDLIFSTIDQTLSNFLSFPLSLSKRQANINAGALVGSYLVFDEFHLLDTKLSMSTSLGVLKRLENLCRFCLMTATLSESYINKLKDDFNVEVVTLKDFPEDINKIGSLKIPQRKKEKKKIKVYKNQKLQAEDILGKHLNKTIVICNRVERAQQLYYELVNDVENIIPKENIICLHARFFEKDRKKKEEKLKKLFGKDNSESAILISTQVIEAGMDISCDTMHVEISPVNSFLQRAGRCARWENQYGEIYVYDVVELGESDKINVETDKEIDKKQIRALNNKYLPYDRDICVNTIEKLESETFLNEEIAQRLVDDILSEKEKKDFDLIKQTFYNKDYIRDSWQSCDKGMYAYTIRDIQSVDIVIVDYNREEFSDFYPYQYQSIGVYKWSFIKWMKEIFIIRDFDRDKEIVFVPKPNQENQFLDGETLNSDKYYLQAITDIESLKQGVYDLIFVDQSIFKYTSETGLEIGEGNFCSPLKPNHEKNNNEIIFRKDTFYQHNKALLNCYEEEFKPKLQFTFLQLNKYWGETIDWDKLIKVMICLHDYGKLNKEWQKPMQKQQELKATKDSKYVYDPFEILAHSDFNQKEDKDIKVKKKPPHAGIGAFVLNEAIEDLLKYINSEELLKVVSNAILKHHGVDTVEYPDFQITPKAYKEMGKLLTEINIITQLREQGRRGKINNLLDNEEEWIIYLFLVRILRLCDQRATKNCNKYLKTIE